MWIIFDRCILDEKGTDLIKNMISMDYIILSKLLLIYLTFFKL